MIEELMERLTALAEALEPIGAGPIENPNGDGQVLVIRDGYKAHNLPGERKNARVHVFDDLRSFADFMNRHAVESSGDPGADAPGPKGKESVEILASEKEVCALLDPQNVAGDRLTCPLRAHPLFAAWEAVFGKQLLQKQFHSFVRGAADSFTEEALESLAGQLLKLRAAGGADMDLELDELGYSKLAGHTQTMTISAKLPPRFQILVPVIDGVRDPESAAEKRYVI